MEIEKLRQIIKEELKKTLEDQSTTTGDKNLFDDYPAVDMHIDDNGFMSISIHSIIHTPDNGKVAVLLQHPQLREAVVFKLQREIRDLFRRTVHGIAGEPFDLP